LEYILEPVKKKMPNGIDKEEVFLRIKKIRGPLSQKEFAKILGVNQATVCKYEAGRLPDALTLKRIANHGGVTVEWILGGEEKGAAPQLRELAPEGYSATLSDIETELLIQAVVAVEQVIKMKRLKLTLEQKARLFVKVYDDCRAAHERPSLIHAEKALYLRD
jgi:transcriptional regulator with XRE-family HTH domain